MLFIASTAGAIIGWFVQTRVSYLVIFCALVSLVIQIASIIFFGPRIDVFSFNNFVLLCIYMVVPYLLIYLFPVIVMALLFRLTRVTFYARLKK
jgi:hypothetical protein